VGSLFTLARARFWRIAPCVALLLFGQRGFSQGTYGVDSATLTNGARVKGDRRIITGIGGKNNGTVIFTNVTVSADGLYPMVVSFVTSDDAAFEIMVNEDPPRGVIFKRTAQGKNDVNRQSIDVPLKAGANSIRFDNPNESGPDLEKIEIQATPAESFQISGFIRTRTAATTFTAGTGVRVNLSGDLERTATVDAEGHYEFTRLPKGDYYVHPVGAGLVSEPYDYRCAGLATNRDGRNFTVRSSPAQPPKISPMSLGSCRIEYDLANGTFNILKDSKLIVSNAYAMVRVPETITSMDATRHEITGRQFGTNQLDIKFTVESLLPRGGRMIQTFWLNRYQDYLFLDVEIVGNPSVSSSFMAPLVTESPASPLPGGDDRTLFVPYDNDKWVRYNSVPFGRSVTSYEVSAWFNNESREGLVIGSVEHDTWKTGVKSTTVRNRITSLEAFGGMASHQTRDILPHGKVSGALIKSPKIMVGFFPDWRAGMITYGRENTKSAPRRLWTNGVPFGWNSWGKLQFRISPNNATEVSDFFSRELQPNHFENDGIVYIGLDSGWDHFNDEQLREFVDHCHSNHQEAGIYFTPFTTWRSDGNSTVEGTDNKYKYDDIFLRANGQRQTLDGGTAIDPTHPGTQMRIEEAVTRFKKAGFKYIKVDFLTHGALEADRHYDTNVTTGIQAYNAGMKFLRRAAGEDIFLNEAISPLFPANYAHSRRIACDSFGDIDKTEYTLNALTYGWWLGMVYDYNDADHVVLEGYSEGENRARVTSAVITGLFITGDDFSESGNPVARERALKYLTNPDINELARRGSRVGVMGHLFAPLEGNTANAAANQFRWEDGEYFYVAVFNYSAQSAYQTIDFKRIGFDGRGPVTAKELWSGKTSTVTSPLTVALGPADAAVYRFKKLANPR